MPTAEANSLLVIFGLIAIGSVLKMRPVPASSHSRLTPYRSLNCADALASAPARSARRKDRGCVANVGKANQPRARVSHHTQSGNESIISRDTHRSFSGHLPRDLAPIRPRSGIFYFLPRGPRVVSTIFCRGRARVSLAALGAAARRCGSGIPCLSCSSNSFAHIMFCVRETATEQ